MTTSHSKSPLRALRAMVLLIALSSFATALAMGCGGQKAAETPEPAATAAPATPAETPAATPAPVAEAGDVGAKVFATKCALCHGPSGHGDGAASKALNPKPRNFHDKAYMATRTDAQLLEVIHQGKGAMPKWEGQLSEAEIAAVLKHIRELGETD